MLKTECPECQQWVSSPLLTELKETSCPDCGSRFPVDGLYVTAGPFSIHRKSLLEKEHKYTELLKKTKTELTKYKYPKNGKLADALSVATLDLFVSGLEELMAGCRDKFRVTVKEKVISYSTDSLPQQGRLINISTSGVCIESTSKAGELQKGTFVILIIDNIDTIGTIYLHGEVVWTTDKDRIGIRFINNEPETRERVKKYMLEIM